MHSPFLHEGSDDEDSGKAGINKILQREAVKKRDTQQVLQLMTEGPAVHEFGEVYDKIENGRKKTIEAKLGTDKKP